MWSCIFRALTRLERTSILITLRRTKWRVDVTGATTCWSRNFNSRSLLKNQALLRSVISTVDMACPWHTCNACLARLTPLQRTRVRRRVSRSRHNRATCRRSELITRHLARIMRAPKATADLHRTSWVCNTSRWNGLSRAAHLLSNSKTLRTRREQLKFCSSDWCECELG